MVQETNNSSKHSIGSLLSVGLLLALTSCASAFAASITYTYDNLSRLTDVDYGNGISITYTYDAAGNRLARQVILDTDSDGIPDNVDPDDDNDGFTDVLEVKYGSDPLDNASLPQAFTDIVPGNIYHPATLGLDDVGVVSDCDGSGNFCPNQLIQRDTAAIWLVKAFEGGTYSPSGASGTVFADVGISTFAADYIEDLKLHSGTEGCDAATPLPNYCPEQGVTKDQAAKMLLKTKYGVGFSPSASGLVFDDVAISTFAAGYIEYLRNVEIATEGCSDVPPLYCSNEILTRGGFAKMLANTFGLMP